MSQDRLKVSNPAARLLKNSQAYLKKCGCCTPACPCWGTSLYVLSGGAPRVRVRYKGYFRAWYLGDPFQFPPLPLVHTFDKDFVVELTGGYNPQCSLYSDLIVLQDEFPPPSLGGGSLPAWGTMRLTIHVSLPLTEPSYPNRCSLPGSGLALPPLFIYNLSHSVDGTASGGNQIQIRHAAASWLPPHPFSLQITSQSAFYPGVTRNECGSPSYLSPPGLLTITGGMGYAATDPIPGGGNFPSKFTWLDFKFARDLGYDTRTYEWQIDELSFEFLDIADCSPPGGEGDSLPMMGGLSNEDVWGGKGCCD
jgi:hypothetical protein